jgi:hypothetical protein
MATVFTIIAILAAAGAVMNAAVTFYWSRQTSRILAGLPKEPRPWYVRLFDKVFP